MRDAKEVMDEFMKKLKNNELEYGITKQEEEFICNLVNKIINKNKD